MHLGHSSGLTVRMLPNVFRLKGIEDVLPTQQAADSTRGIFGLMRAL